MRDAWWIKPEQLDDYQRRAIALPPQGSYVVTGPPGSGKTNLLILRADYLAKSSLPNHLFLVFNRTLEEFIAHCPASYRMERSRLKTLLRWEMELINQLGGTPATSGDFDKNRRSNCTVLSALLAQQNLANIYDAILLDEAQDYLSEEIELLSTLTPNLFAVADSRQQIYNHADPVPVLKSFCQHLELPNHYRNGGSICKVLDGVGRHWTDYTPLEPTSQYNERDMPSRVALIELPSLDAQLGAVLDAIPLQLKAYPQEMIGVLCPRKEDFAAAVRHFEQSDLDKVTVYQGGDSGYCTFEESTRICVCSLHSSKGLEFRAVHILNAQYIASFRELQRRVTYTAFSRAKTVLDVYHSPQKKIASYIEGAFAAAAPRGAPPTIEDLFNG